MNSLDKKYEYVIQAIEHLKHRKARPDLEGIKNYAFRRHGIDPDTCCADVDELIDSEHIIKVEFKGRTSYRNAAKYFGADSSLNTTQEMSPQPSRDASPEPASYSSAVTAAIAAILCDQPTPPSQTGAVNIRSIASYLQSRDHGRYSRKYIDSLIDREIAANNIACISKETFTLPPSVLKGLDRRWKHDHVKSKRKPSVSTEELSKSKNQAPKAKAATSKVEKSPPPTPPRPERVGQRMKRAKKVFDPSDVEVVPRKRGRPVGTGKKNRELRNSFATTPERSKSPYLSASSPPPNNNCSLTELKPCILCKYYTVIMRGVTYKMLVCSECNKNVHAKCLGFDQDVLPRVPESEWKCPDCRPCSVCKLVQDQDNVLLCCECDTTFHRACLNPPPANVPDSCTWVCADCRANESSEKTPVKEVEEAKHDPIKLTSPFLSPAASSIGPWVFGTRQLELKGPPFDWQCNNGTPDPKIPDASAWSLEDVHKYFSQLGFQEQAAVLRQNEIDGPSLLLMKRNDIVGNAGMGLKLGPAVKIYNHIRRLQTRRADLVFA